MATRARDRLVETAERLFYTEGIRAVGVERLLADSGVGRASFYRHFAGKDDLVASVLRERDMKWRQTLEKTVAELGGGPLAVFDALGAMHEAGDCHGCSFNNAVAETAGTDDAVRRLAIAHKNAVADYVKGLLAGAGYGPRLGEDGMDEMAWRFVLLVDGASMAAVRDGSAAPARRARAMAEILLNATEPGDTERGR